MWRLDVQNFKSKINRISFIETIKSVSYNLYFLALMYIYCISIKLLLIWKFVNIPIYAEKLFMTKDIFLKLYSSHFISLSDQGDLIQL